MSYEYEAPKPGTLVGNVYYGSARDLLNDADNLGSVLGWDDLDVVETTDGGRTVRRLRELARNARGLIQR